MPTHPCPDYLKIIPKSFKKNQPLDIQYLLTQTQGTRAGGEAVASFSIHYWQERLLLSGSGSKTTARRPAACQWRGSPSTYFHIDKCRKLNSAELGHLEEIQIFEAAELTINTLVKHSHSGTEFCFCLSIFFIPTAFNISTGKQQHLAFVSPIWGQEFIGSLLLHVRDAETTA